jgi:protein-L-isoaspartate(D-aspartate) O-methyltransferase
MNSDEINDNAQLRARRDFMVKTQIEARGVTDSAVLDAMRKVPRHLFLPLEAGVYAHEDSPYSIGYGQTISQPFIVAFMTELLHLRPSDKVLDIGTGSGYQAAVLAEIVAKVFSIEIVPELRDKADSIFKTLGYVNIFTRIGDGYFGWLEEAPFNGIIVAAAPGKVPIPLLDQLDEGGRLVIPVGETFQFLEVYTKYRGKVLKEKNIAVRFVPMTGRAEHD